MKRCGLCALIVWIKIFNLTMKGKNMIKTRYEKLKQKEAKIRNFIYDLDKEKEQKTEELKAYCKKHRLNWECLETGNVAKLKKIYAYFDKRYKIKWQGGLRCDDRGMALCFWLDDDPDYLIIHITSTSENICFGGSTSWIVRSETLEDKINLLKTIKKDILNILKEED